MDEIDVTAAVPVVGEAGNGGDGQVPVAEMRFSSALSLVAGALHDATSLDEVYVAVVEGARLVASSDAAVLNLLASGGERIVSAAAAGAHGAELVGYEMPIEGSVSGRVIQSGQPVVVDDCQGDETMWRPAGEVGEVGEFGPALVVPVLDRDGSAFGAIVVANLVAGPGFYGSCLAELTRFAHHVGICIQTARRFLAGNGTQVASVGGSLGLRALNDVSHPGRDVAWSMIEASPNAMVITDEHGLIELVNNQTETLFGYDRGELLGRPIETLIPHRFAQTNTAHRTRYRAAPEVRQMGSGLDLTALRRDGTEVPVEVSLSPVEADGKLRIIAVVRDISDRVAAEVESRLIQATIDATHDGVFMFRTEDDMDFTYVNQGAVDQTGYSRSELLAMTPLHIKPEFTRESFLAKIAPLISGESERVTFTTVHRRKSGRDVPVEIILEYPQTAVSGSKRVMVALVRDISERAKVAEAASRRQALTTALSEVRFAMLNGATRGEGLQLMCDRAKSALDGSAALLLTPITGTDELRIEAATGLSDDLRAEVRFHQGKGTGLVFRTGKAERSNRDDPRIAPEHVDLARQDWAASTLAVPLHGAESVFGVLHLTRSAASEPLGESDLEALEQYASAAAVAIELAAIREAHAHMELLQDRERIARDMHDKVIGRLFAAGMNMQSTLTQVVEPFAKDRLSTAVDEVDEAIREIRTTVFELRADADWGRGVRGEVLALASSQSDTLGFEPVVNFAGPVDDLPGTVVEQLLAVLREAFTNIAKYAHARKVVVTITVSETGVHAQIVDDGVGFAADVTDAESSPLDGNGLSNMAIRAQTLGGDAAITSAPGEGTTVDWTVPLG